MMSLPQVCIGLSLALVVLDILMTVFYFYVRKDVIIADLGFVNVLTVIILVILGLFAVGYGVVLARGYESERMGILAVSGSLFLTLLILWFFLEIDMVKKRGMEILKTIVSILEVENSNLDGHSLHVHNLTMLLYDYLPSKMKRSINEVNLAYASLVIDLGKLGVPARILNKTGKLLSDEWAMMKRHPEISAKIFEPIPSFDAISDWILYHHERMDGNGYHRKRGGEIPLAARVITVADTFSSITTVRAFKPSLIYEDAIAELKLAAGSQLDPEIVSIFCSIPRNKVEECFEDVRRRMARFEAEGFRGGEDAVAEASSGHK